LTWIKYTFDMTRPDLTRLKKETKQLLILFNIFLKKYKKILIHFYIWLFFKKKDTNIIILTAEFKITSCDKSANLVTANSITKNVHNFTTINPIIIKFYMHIFSNPLNNFTYATKVDFLWLKYLNCSLKSLYR
jgi:hypothetical protein